jgi:hypothetical protein
MKHKESSVKVYCTTDYSIFKKMDGNRGLNKRKIERIIKEISSGNDILDEVPILVAENMEVRDGQHRLAIAQSLKRPVHYIIHKKKMSMYQVARVNTNVEKWKPADFINCYIKAGNDNYKLIKKFIDTYGIAVGSALVMLKKGTFNHTGGMDATSKLNTEFETGVFEVKSYRQACQLAEICKSFSEFPAWNSRSFIIAISRIVQKNQCDFSVLIKKFKAYPKRLLQQPNYKGYLANLEEVYNIDNSKRRTIY